MSIARSRPYILRDLPNRVTEVLLSPKSAVFGTFKTDLRPMLTPGFVFGPNPRTEPLELVSQPASFHENKQFLNITAQAFSENIHLDKVYSDLVAGETKTRYFHIYDFRMPPLFGRIPEVEDIIGTVELDIGRKETQIVPLSFKINPMYRPVTRFGAMLVSDQMFDVLKHTAS